MTKQDVIFAHSWGSWIALELSRHAPIPARFVLANPVPFTSEGNQVVLNRLRARITQQQLARLNKATSGADMMRILLRSYCGHKGPLPRLSFHYNPRKGSCIDAEVGDYDHRDLFAAVAPRTLLIFGATDYIQPADFLPTAASYQTLPKGHFGFAEATGTYSKAIHAFLAEGLHHAKRH